MKTFQLDCLHAILKSFNQLLLAIRPFSSDYERLLEDLDEEEKSSEEVQETAKNEIKKKEKKKLRKSSKK